ncbi:MAG: hypothetical protein ACYC1M_07110 [Armatimonadota bacterium]
MSRIIVSKRPVAATAVCLSTCLLFLVARCTSASVPERSPDQAIGIRYLAADPTLRAEMTNTCIVVGQATYVGPMVTLSTANWEKDWYFRNHGQVSYDPTVYSGQYPKHPWRWWYMLKSRVDGSICWSYAESSDGIRWKKPVLNPKGDSHTPEPNNIVHHDTGYFNPNPNALSYERYLCLSRHSDDPTFHRLYVQTSPDGINFSAPVLVFNEPSTKAYALDGGNQIYWDAAERKYVLTVRYWYNASGSPAPGAGTTEYRGGATKRSATIKGLLNAPLEYNLKPNLLYGPITENCDDIYMTNIVAYHGQFIATPNVFHDPRDNHNSSWTETLGVSGPIYPQLLYSRDSRTWFADPETKGSSLIALTRHNPNFKADGDMIFTEPLVEQGGKLWFFYSYRDFPHNSYGGKDEKTRSMTTHIAQMRVDGFMAIANKPGKVGIWTTPAIQVPANTELRLNTVVAAGGSVKVEMLDPSGKQINDYTVKESAAIKKGDYLAAKPSWRGSRSLKGLARRRVKLRFILESASLYSFEFVKSTK